MQVVPKHDEKALVSRFVETKLLLQALDERWIEPLRAAIFGIDLGLRAACHGAAVGEVAAGRARNPRGGAGVDAGQLSYDAFHRSARGKLNHHERNQHDPE